MPKLKLRPKTIVSVGSLIAVILALLSGISLATQSAGLSFWRKILLENFGWTSYLTPVVLLLTALVLQKFKFAFAQSNVLVGLLVIMAALAGLFGAFSETASGAIGTLVWSELSTQIHPVGAFLGLIIVLSIGLIVLFDTPLSTVWGLFAALASGFASLANLGSLIPFGRSNEGIDDRKLAIKVSGIDDRSKPVINKAAVEDKPVITDSLVQNVAGQGQVWKYPPASLLSDNIGSPADRGDVKKYAALIEKTLDSFGIQARVAEVNGGPAVTQYALEIPAGTKIAKIASLQHDIALALATPTGTVRIEAPIPGKSLVGIEVPNRSLEVVGLKKILLADEMTKNKSKLAVALGRDTSSKPMVVDIARMPHCLVAGTTGSGKSVLLNTFIISLLFRNSPEELKMILIDPKRVELTNYNDIPHLLSPVITEPDKILSSLKWAMAEMDRRYKLFQSVGVRNIQGYNEMSGFQALPNIVIVIDELADLMMFAPVEVEDAITRLAQLARATGIHLVVATQRPSVDVITGLIKANIPCRVAFNVSSMVDSRVIIDQQGAEKLLGRGDMLYMPPDAAKPLRIQGVYVHDNEINNLIKYLKQMGMGPQYTAEVTEMPIGRLGGKGASGGGGGDGRDEMFDEAVKTVCQYDKASASLLQRRLRVGYARAARLMDELEEAGIIGPGEGSKPRDVLIRNVDEYFNQQANAA